MKNFQYILPQLISICISRISHPTFKALHNFFIGDFVFVIKFFEFHQPLFYDSQVALLEQLIIIENSVSDKISSLVKRRNFGFFLMARWAKLFLSSRVTIRQLWWLLITLRSIDSTLCPRMPPRWRCGESSL